jgi:hypothetical protein
MTNEDVTLWSPHKNDLQKSYLAQEISVPKTPKNDSSNFSSLQPSPFTPSAALKNSPNILLFHPNHAL